MQTYNYAEEILKDEEYPLHQSSYAKDFSFTSNDGYLYNLDEHGTVNTNVTYKFTKGNIAAYKKENAFREGIKNDGITIADDKAQV